MTRFDKRIDGGFMRVRTSCGNIRFSLELILDSALGGCTNVMIKKYKAAVSIYDLGESTT